MLFCINRDHPSEMSQTGSQWSFYNQFTIRICREMHTENALTDWEDAECILRMVGRTLLNPEGEAQWRKCGTCPKMREQMKGRWGLQSHWKMKNNSVANRNGVTTSHFFFPAIPQSQQTRGTLANTCSSWLWIYYRRDKKYKNWRFLFRQKINFKKGIARLVF